MALHALAGDRVELTVVAPGNHFVDRPLATKEPYAVGRIRQVPVDRAARDAGATLFPLTVESVDTRARIVSTVRGRQFEYDALVLALGADAVPEVPRAITWDDRSAADMLAGLLQGFEQGYRLSLAVFVPPGPGWPLRAFELALLITLDRNGHRRADDDHHAGTLGAGASRASGLRTRPKEVARAGVAVVSADRVEIEQGQRATVALEPSGQRLEVDRLLALPGLRGRPVAGLPTDADARGFIEVDEHCRVRGLDRVWAVGDCTAFPVKSGGFAAEHAVPRTSRRVPALRSNRGCSTRFVKG
ncbi:MAG TPA: FAD-dependent oxidoreductase [Solirubrobacteraceae bacterium]|nr:FAD-dependent oxidoreductase [Solirubrobacteraceae bacterium]